MRESRSYIAIPPGVTIKEQLDDRGITQKEFAIRMGISEKHTSKLINGDVQLTIDMAMRLESVLGIPTQFWCNLESIYREKLALVSEENSLDEDIELLPKFPYNELAKLGWVSSTKNKYERVKNLRKYFEIASFKNLNDCLFPRVVYRKLSIKDDNDYKLLAWVQKAKAEARNIFTNKINISRLKQNLSTIRSLSLLSADEFPSKLVSILADCGIALVLLPHISGTFLHGATFIDNDKIVIALTLRGKDADKFWFSLFHELGHIVYNHLSFEYENSFEEIADSFARNTLIPTDDYNNLINSYNFTTESISIFAEQIGIPAGIIVGRLQNDHIIPYTALNHLKIKYQLSD